MLIANVTAFSNWINGIMVNQTAVLKVLNQKRYTIQQKNNHKSSWISWFYWYHWIIHGDLFYRYIQMAFGIDSKSYGMLEKAHKKYWQLFGISERRSSKTSSYDSRSRFARASGQCFTKVSFSLWIIIMVDFLY